MTAEVRLAVLAKLQAVSLDTLKQTQAVYLQHIAAIRATFDSTDSVDRECIAKIQDPSAPTQNDITNLNTTFVNQMTALQKTFNQKILEAYTAPPATTANAPATAGKRKTN
ncbi:MAG TPA: hypothetical protein VMG98_02195 [Verrucomicrobiae bacterium]|nr:hypothetical protein [Verrucomicrobiae bacterium]